MVSYGVSSGVIVMYSGGHRKITEYCTPSTPGYSNRCNRDHCIHSSEQYRHIWLTHLNWTGLNIVLLVELRFPLVGLKFPEGLVVDFTEHQFSGGH